MKAPIKSTAPSSPKATEFFNNSHLPRAARSRRCCLGPHGCADPLVILHRLLLVCCSSFQNRVISGSTPRTTEPAGGGVATTKISCTEADNAIAENVYHVLGPYTQPNNLTQLLCPAAGCCSSAAVLAAGWLCISARDRVYTRTHKSTLQRDGHAPCSSPVCRSFHVPGIRTTPCAGLLCVGSFQGGVPWGGIIAAVSTATQQVGTLVCSHYNIMQRTTFVLF